MSSMTFSTSTGAHDSRTLLEKLRAKFGPLAAVLAAHAVLLYVLYSGLLTRMVDAAVPQAVIVHFIDLPRAPAPPPAAPKVVPVVQLQPPPLPQVPVPVVQLAPQPNAITVEQAAAPAPKAPAAPAVVAAPAAPASGEPKTVTSGVEYIRTPQFVYPEMSRRMGEQGRVVLRVLVNEKGLPEKVQVQTSSGFARLDEASRLAGLRAQFKPYMEDGRPIAVYVLLPFSYSNS